MSPCRNPDDDEVHSLDPHARPYSQVKPYHFDFSCSVKRRQAGKSVIDIFVKEFSEIALGKPTRIPVLNHTDPEALGMGFLSHSLNSAPSVSRRR